MLLTPGLKASTQVNGIGGQLALVGFLIVLNAAFAGSEIALISLREGQLARLEQRSARGRALAKLVRESNRFLSTIQIGITLPRRGVPSSVAGSDASLVASGCSRVGRLIAGRGLAPGEPTG